MNCMQNSWNDFFYVSLIPNNPTTWWLKLFITCSNWSTLLGQKGHGPFSLCSVCCLEVSSNKFNHLSLFFLIQGLFTWLTKSTFYQGFDKRWTWTRSGLLLVDLTFVNYFRGQWLPEGRWRDLILAMGGQAASAKRRAALLMAAQRAAIHTSQTLGLKTGRQTRHGKCCLFLLNTYMWASR